MVLLAIAMILAVWEGFPGQRRILLESIAQITSRMQGLLDLSNWGAMSWIYISISALLLAFVAHWFPPWLRHHH